MYNKKNIVLGFVVSIILITIGVYFYLISPVSKDAGMKEIEIGEGSSYLSIDKILKDNNLIRSQIAYKLYIKINKPTSVEACKYYLSENMGVKEIVEKLSDNCTTSTESINITIPEGYYLEEIAEVASNVTNNTKKEIMNTWNSEKFIEDIINKYEMISKDILKKGIRYPLEGYLFPSTYELINKEVTPEYIAYKMLDQLEIIYNKYKKDIEKSQYTFHEILTLASIVEHEAVLDEDRPIIASVFYNRLSPNNYETNGLLQSCATTKYVINEHKMIYTDEDNAVDSPYNTYLYPGLPIGPGNSPGEKSIYATIYPANTKYYYFLANVCDPNNKKTQFSKTHREHLEKSKILAACN